MLKKGYIIILILALGTVVTLTYAYFEFQKTATVDIANHTTADKLSADALISMFINDKAIANATYVEKTIEVEGVVKEINFLNNRHTILLQSEEFAQNAVICDMMPSSKEKPLRIGDNVTIKGICKGFLSDVIMLNCIPIDTTNK